MVKHWFAIKKQSNLIEHYIAPNDKKAHTIRKELVKREDVVGVTPIIPITNSALPMEFRATIKRARDYGK